MSDGFGNKPRILRGAFVALDLRLPPPVVVFQFNPLQLARNRSLTFAVPSGAAGSPQTLREFHGRYTDLRDLQREQLVTVQEQTIGFELRLDATDALDERDPVAESLGVGPQIATLELMVQPTAEGILGGLDSPGFSFTRASNPPLVLFVFGRKRVLPVNITAMNITETEFSAELDPVRATVTVNLTVIEGPSVPYAYTRFMAEAVAAAGLAHVADVADVALPG